MSEESESILSSLNKRQNEFNVIRTRIDTEELIEKIEFYLRGAKYVTIQDDEGVKTKSLKAGIPLANEYGIQSVLKWISMSVNTHTVQGNFRTDKSGFSKEYDDFKYYFRRDFGDYLWDNRINFDIRISEYLGIIDSVMNLITCFMSRLIDNLERISYYETTRSVESNVVKAKGGLGILN